MISLMSNQTQLLREGGVNKVESENRSGQISYYTIYTVFINTDLTNCNIK